MTHEQKTGNERRTTTLGDCVVVNDAAYSPKEAWLFINYLDTGNITENRISEIQHLIAGKDKIPSRARRKVQPGDIVYSTVRPNQRHFGLLKELPKNFLASTGFAVIRGKDGLARTDFIYWFLAQDHIVEHLHTIAEQSVSAYPSIRPGDIEQLKLRLPPLPEQRRIAHILGTLDDKIALNRRMNETLEEMARALFKAWFIDFEPVRAKIEGRWRRGESLPGMPAELYDLFPDRLVDSELGAVPEGWAVGRITDFADVSSGKRPGLRYPVASKKASIPLWGGNGPMAFVSEPLVDYPILLTGRVGTLGSVFRITSPCWPSDNTLILRAKRDIFFEYMFFNLERVNFDILNRGSTQPLLAQSDLKAQLVLLPPISIIEYFSGCVTPLFDSYDKRESESRTLAAMRDTLLPKLISGALSGKGILAEGMSGESSQGGGSP